MKVKNIKNVRKYVSVDGGMGDNPRYILYGAEYTSVIANKAGDAADDKVTIAGNGKTADATRLMAIMAMGIKKGMEVEVTVEGENEEAAAAKMEEFFKANL